MAFRKGNDDVRGDSKPMPDKGTGTGFNGDTYGADVSGDATNTQGKVQGTKSDPVDMTMPHGCDCL